MGNDMFNDEQLVFLELRQKETEEGLSWWKGRALKAEAERDALLARLDAPPADEVREAVLAAREEAERLLAQPLFFRETMKPWCDALRSFLSATSSPAPAPSAPAMRRCEVRG